LVRITDNNFKLPDGSTVESGVHFRNSFHLRHDL